MEIPLEKNLQNHSLIKSERKENFEEINSLKTYKNLFIISLSFLCNFTAFGSLQNLQSSIHESRSIGMISLAVIYVCFVISCVLIPPFLIHKLGCKFTVILSTTGYILYTTAHFYPKWWTLMIASALVGICAAPLWSAKATYITNLATQYSKSTNQTSEKVITKFFAIFYMIFQINQVIGNLISSLVLKPTQDTFSNNTNHGSSSNTKVCGSKYCPGSLNYTIQNGAEDVTVNTLMAIYVVFGLVAFAIAYLFMDNIKAEGQSEKKSPTHLLMAVIYQLKDWRIILLFPFTIISGMEAGFIFGDYTEALAYYFQALDPPLSFDSFGAADAFVTCSIGIDKLGFVMIAFGISNVVSSLLVGLLTKWIHRNIMIVFAMISHVSLMIWFLFWQLERSSTSTFYINAALWGVIDSVWQTQTNAYYGMLFPSNQEVAFSIFKMFQSIGFAIAFAYGPVLCITTKLYILMSVIIVGAFLYGVVEWKRTTNENKLASVIE